MTEQDFTVYVIHADRLGPVIRYLESVAEPSVAATIRRAYETDKAFALALTPAEAATVRQIELREIAGGK